MLLQAAVRSFTLAGSVLLLSSCGHRLDMAAVVLAQADEVMGVSTVKTLRYSGSGTGATFGQAYQPGMAWPKLTYTSFSRVLDYDNGALREDFACIRAEPTGGGALPLMGTGEQRSTGLLHGLHAWNIVGSSPVASPIAVDARIHDLWTSPHGVVKAALKHNRATALPDGTRWVISFTERGRYSAKAWIGPDGLVERVDTLQPNPVLGDMQTVTFYTDYRDFGGVKFPARIRQVQGGFPVLDLVVNQVQVNQPAGIVVPPAVEAATERVTADKVAEGVWMIGGGSHNSVLVEMKDHLIMVESPQFDGRALAVLSEVRRLVPDKPLRYVINSHHHFDHAGGLRTAAAAGATLVTSEQARPWFERVLSNPNSIRPDALARSGRKVMVTGVSGQHTLTDGSRTVEVFMITDSIHAQGFLMAWLPRERLLIEADAYTPDAPGTAPPAQPNANNVNLLANIERLKLPVDRIVPLHGRVVPLAELYAAVGRKP